MIVRILGEGQYDVPADAVHGLNQLDAAVEAAVESGNTAAFSTALGKLLAGVRAAGALDESDLILPPSDASIDEVRELLDDDGLIPG